MNEAQTAASSALFGSRRHTSVSRGLGEFHGRRPVLFTATGEAVLALPVEGLDRQRLFEFMALCAPVMPQLGGGVVLYLAQGGRGLGLTNKMPTYQLQDDGFDTFDANTTLGFDDDERDYGIAAHMLRMLDCTRIVLLTNNPAKLDGLTKAGIEIASRMPLDAPVNADNRRFMTAKAARAGPQFDDLTASLADRA
jgi:hypothetical protein